MAFTLGAGPVTATSSGSTLVLTLPGTTAGRSIVVGVRWNGVGSSIDTITCTGESNLTVHGAAVNEAAFTGAFLQNASLANITTGGSKTITVSFVGSVGTLRGFAVEVVGGKIASFFDASTGTTGSSPNPSTTHTTGTNNALIVATGIAYGGNITEGSGYTLIDVSADGDGEYKLDAGVAGAKTVDFVQAYNGAWAIQATSFNLATNDAAFNLPVLTLTSTGTMLGAMFDLPMLTLAAGNPSAIFNLPALTFTGAGAMVDTGFATFNLPALTVSGVGLASGTGLSIFPLPMLTFTGAGQTGDVGTAEFNLPALLVATTALQHGLGNGAFDLPFPTLSAIGFTGGVATAAFDLPMLTLSIAARQDITGTAAFNMPVLFLSAQGASSLASAYRTWVMNVRKGAVTEYNNFSFNSFANFNGACLACGPSGVFVLGTQDTDAGTAITGKYRTAISDLGDTAWVKRVPRIYVDGSQSGDTLFRVITTEGGTRTYNIQWNKLSGQQQRRCPIGKGIKSRFFQFEQENVGGANFSMMSLLTYPTKLRRRIAG